MASGPVRTAGLFMAAVILGSIAGCGPSSNSPTAAPPAAAQADVTVTVDGEHHTCVVSKSNEVTGSTIGCADVVAFVRDELRITGGAAYDVRTLPPVDASDVSKLRTALNGAGYRFVGRSDVGGNP